jgi:hypothetical protein
LERDTAPRTAALMLKKAPNELRIDAAEEEKIKNTFPCAAASIRVELSRAQGYPDQRFGN